jgi:peptidoglycan-associated lipoprotein
MNKMGGVIIILIAAVAMLWLTACAKKSVEAAPEVMEESAADTISEEELEARRQAELEAEQARQEEILRQQQLDEQQRTEEASRQASMTAREAFVNENIYFDFDSYTLETAAQDKLREKAAWLQEHPNAVVIIEGHCDERGTDAYNLALGERRAESAKSFLVDLGVDPAKLTTISYGEEKPMDTSGTEKAWAKNRRACFVLQ